MSLHRGALLLSGLLALLGSLGSLYLSVGMGLEACTLCFYQRAFMLGTFAVLVVGSLAGRGRVNLALFAIPLTVAGLGIALQHTRLVLNGFIECPAGIFALGSAPLQSLILFTLLLASLTLANFTGSGDEQANAPALLVGLALGVILAIGCLNSNPPLKSPTRPYDPVKEPLLGCRKPYRGEN